MFDGSTPTPDAARFAVGDGNGSGPETAPAAATTPVAVPAAVPAGPTRAATVVAPFTARPVGAAHPRRRLGRGLVLPA